MDKNYRDRIPSNINIEQTKNYLHDVFGRAETSFSSLFMNLNLLRGMDFATFEISQEKFVMDVIIQIQEMKTLFESAAVAVQDGFPEVETTKDPSFHLCVERMEKDFNLKLRYGTYMSPEEFFETVDSELPMIQSTLERWKDTLPQSSENVDFQGIWQDVFLCQQALAFMASFFTKRLVNKGKTQH